MSHVFIHQYIKPLQSPHKVATLSVLDGNWLGLLCVWLHCPNKVLFVHLKQVLEDIQQNYW